MPEPILAYDGYDYVEFTIPITGQRLQVKPLPLSKSLHFLRLMRKSQDPNVDPNDATDALIAVAEEFPKALGTDPAIAAAFEPLLPLEVKSAAWDFFSVSRISRLAAAEPTAAPTPTSPSTA